MEVERSDSMSLGVATIHSRRSDLKNPGLLSARTEWKVTIRGRDGQTIRLSPSFLQHVRDVQTMVILIRQSAGLG